MCAELEWQWHLRTFMYSDVVKVVLQQDGQSVLELKYELK